LGILALRDFLYPSIELSLILARSFTVDKIASLHGTASDAFQNVAARILLNPRDMQRLGLSEGDAVEVSSKTKLVIVQVQLDEATPEGLGVMPPSPWVFALITESKITQGTTITVKPTKKTITPFDSLP
jgi:formylmethanofuran dehydrogenase subunit D